MDNEKLQVETFYRVCHDITQQGLWYSTDGAFTGLIHEQLSFCTNNKLEMPYDTEIVGYLSATKTIEELLLWFPLEDIKRLEDFGFFITEYQATDYKLYKNHWVIKREDSVVVKVIPVAELNREKNPYDPIKEPASHRFWNDKQENAPICPTCKCISPLICSSGWHKVNECAPLSEQNQEGETVGAIALKLGYKICKYLISQKATMESKKPEKQNNVVETVEEAAYNDSKSPWVAAIGIGETVIYDTFKRGAQWQSQHTGNQENQYKVRIADLESQLSYYKH